MSDFNFRSQTAPTSAERMPWLVVRADGTVLAGNWTQGGALVTAARLEAFVVRRVSRPAKRRAKRRQNGGR